MRGLLQKFYLARFFFSYKIGKSKLDFPPFFIWIEPTNSCNLKCAICSRNTLSKKTGFMDINLYKNIIAQLKVINPLVITLHLAGEPLLHPHLPEMVKMATDNGISTTFSTNGMILSEEISNRLMDSGLKSLRIDFSPDKEKFEFARNGASWDKVYNNINRFLEIRKKRNSKFPVVKIQNIRFSQGIDSEQMEMSKLKELFKSNPADEYFHFQTHSWSGIFAKNEIKKPTYELSVKKGKFHPCTHLWNSFVISYDGKVVPCCRDLNNELILGDIRKNTITEIWTNTNYQNLRNLHIKKEIDKIDLCSYCSKPYEKTRFSYYFARYFYVKFDEFFRKRKP
jgi:radical SAM protein with 4Fe4S-binding SPASM domain